jgi:hypothetical protein
MACTYDDIYRALIEVRLNSGRAIGCDKYLVSATYGEFQLRTPSEKANEEMLRFARHDAESLFGRSLPIHIIQPARVDQLDYPAVRFAGCFDALPMHPEMHASSLVIIWFQDQQHPILDDAAQVAIQAIHWESLAVDYVM